MTVYWVPFLHAYQPPWQDVNVLVKIYNDCYKPLLSMMERHKNIKLTLNIQGCLLDQLAELNIEEAKLSIQRLVTNQKVELVGSAKYHPILPLTPRMEIKRQIQLNKETLTKYFPDITIQGFFPPEMAVSPELCRDIQENGYRWIIMDGIANSGQWPHNYFQLSPSKIVVLFRDTFISNMISFNAITATEFVEKITHMYGGSETNDYYIITAQDAETFGHHIPYYETSFLGKAFSLIEDNELIEVCTISELLEKFPIKESPPIKASTWSTSSSDLALHVPYPLWQHPHNPVHKYQYRMLKALHNLMAILKKKYPPGTKNADFENYYLTARHFYDFSLSSCWLWWSSMKPMWSPNLIYKGIDIIYKSALNAQLALINVKIGEGEEFYSRVMDNGEKLMNELIEQEARGQKVHTYGDEPLD